MNCERFREQITVDPASADAELIAHERDCPACAAWAQRARKAEALIHRALRFDTAKAAAGSVRRPAALGSIAAAAIAGLAFWFGLAVDRPASADELVAGILGHMDHEPHALEFTTVRVGARDLRYVLAGDATIDLALLDTQLGPVTFAKRCAVAGQWMSHLVVQSDDGPVTVLVLRQQTVDGIVPLELAGQGLGGSIVPAGRGAIAVLGGADAANPDTARRVADAVEISI